MSKKFDELAKMVGAKGYKPENADIIFGDAFLRKLQVKKIKGMVKEIWGSVSEVESNVIHLQSLNIQGKKRELTDANIQIDDGFIAAKAGKLTYFLFDYGFSLQVEPTYYTGFANDIMLSQAISEIKKQTTFETPPVRYVSAILRALPESERKPYEEGLLKFCTKGAEENLIKLQAKKNSCERNLKQVQESLDCAEKELKDFDIEKEAQKRYKKALPLAKPKDKELSE